MLSVLAELHFAGVRVISVADGLDSHDEEATLGIQIRGIFNELQLRDLKNKTLRGQIGQKQRGFSVGEHTYGYRSVAVGATRLDKKGRLRPEGYKMESEPREAAVVLRIFRTYADGFIGYPHRATPERRERAGKNALTQGLVASHREPNARQREIHRPLGMEQDGATP